MKTAILKLSAQEILAETNPFNIFSWDFVSSHTEYGLLSKRWHPDICHESEATEVFIHIKGLYEQVKEKREGRTTTGGAIELESLEGKKYRVRYKKMARFELGVMYIADTVVVYVVEKEYDYLYTNAISVISNDLKFSSPKIEKEVSRYLPAITSHFETTDEKLVLVVKKTPDLLCLKDVLAHFEDNIDMRHAAWIISSLYNLACYFKHIGIVHCGISTDSYFISPVYHSGAMLGGWWYATKEGESLIGVSSKNYSAIPVDVIESKKAEARIDSDLIKMVGREAMGDRKGSSLLNLGGKLRPLVNWLMIPSTGDTTAEYASWYDRVLVDTFGKPKFIELKLTVDDLYKEYRGRKE